MLGSMIVFDLNSSAMVCQFPMNSAVNCLGSLQRSSGFRLGTTLLQIGNLNTPALSDSKCVLFAINLPCILLKYFQSKDPQIVLPLLESIVEVVIENIKSEQATLNTLDLDLLINADQEIKTSTSYLTILTALCDHWAHRVIEMEDELQLDEE